MSKPDQPAHHVGSSYHPVCHYDSPEDVLDDARLSTDEKRVILSSWASDMYVVESQPALRDVPGIPYPLRLDDILAALKRLDEDSDPPPRGGVPCVCLGSAGFTALLQVSRSILPEGSLGRGGPGPGTISLQGRDGAERRMCGDIVGC